MVKAMDEGDLSGIAALESTQFLGFTGVEVGGNALQDNRGGSGNVAGVQASKISRSRSAGLVGGAVAIGFAAISAVVGFLIFLDTQESGVEFLSAT